LIFQIEGTVHNFEEDDSQRVDISFFGSGLELGLLGSTVFHLAFPRVLWLRHPQTKIAQFEPTFAMDFYFLVLLMRIFPRLRFKWLLPPLCRIESRVEQISDSIFLRSDSYIRLWWLSR
jgi:hypothetical protein